MEIKVNEQTYKIDKFTRAKSKMYDEAFGKIKSKSEAGQMYSDEDYDLMVSTLVKIYDHQFSEAKLNDEDITDIIFAFINIQVGTQEKLNNRIEASKKAFTKRK